MSKQDERDVAKAISGCWKVIEIADDLDDAANLLRQMPTPSAGKRKALMQLAAEMRAMSRMLNDLDLSCDVLEDYWRKAR